MSYFTITIAVIIITDANVDLKNTVILLKNIYIFKSFPNLLYCMYNYFFPTIGESSLLAYSVQLPS